MKRSCLITLAALGCLALAGCGAASNTRAVGLTNVPLPSGAKITAHVRSCDRGASAYCSVQLVVVGNRYLTSAALLAAEQQYVTHLGWSTSNGQTGKQQAAESPGHELRLTYATVYDDLLGVDSGWIQRTAGVARAMSTAIFDRAPAISIMLQRGPS